MFLPTYKYKQNSSLEYNTLFNFPQFLTARPTKIISNKRHGPPDSTYIMYHPSKLN